MGKVQWVRYRKIVSRVSAAPPGNNTRSIAQITDPPAAKTARQLSPAALLVVHHFHLGIRRKTADFQSLAFHAKCRDAGVIQ